MSGGTFLPFIYGSLYHDLLHQERNPPFGFLHKRATKVMGVLTGIDRLALRGFAIFVVTGHRLRATPESALE
jgi:hypothetical protein